MTNVVEGVGKKLRGVSTEMAGAGAAGPAVHKLLLGAGATQVTVADDQGAVHEKRPGLNPSLRWIAEHTNRDGYAGDLAGSLPGAHVFIGLSPPHILEAANIKTLAGHSILVALAHD